MIPFGKLPDEEKVETVQSKFLKQEWSDGIVHFKNRNAAVELPLIFDVYNNHLYFLQGNQIMEFQEPVSEFTLRTVLKKDSVAILFRNNYPDIEKNTAETFYEVLVDGEIQLLKCKAKTILLHKDMDVPEERRDYSKELFYAFYPDNKITQIKADKDYLLQHLPKQAATIRKIIESKKIKIKNESSLIELFRLLNQQ
ncbi:MAG: hypothetical protein ACTHOF_13305 [Flavisolibacter sp.]